MRFDNNMISITGMGFEDFEKAMSFFDLKNIKGFEVNKKKGLMLYWAEHERMTSMPFEHTVGGIVNFSWEWLQASSAAADIRGPGSDDSDVTFKAAWQVYNEDWTQVDDLWHCRCAVKPIWAMFGK